MRRVHTVLALILVMLFAASSRGEEPSSQGAFSQWKAKLASADPAERQRAIVVLTELLPDQSAAAPYLVAALGDPIVAVRDSAAVALAAMGQDALPGLIACLESGDSEIRVRAMEIIRRYGSDAADAVNPLIALLEDEHPAVREASAATLAAIGKASAPAAGQLNALLHDEDEAVRWAALLALARIDGFLPVAIGDLEELAARIRSTAEAAPVTNAELPSERELTTAAALCLLRPDAESFRLLGEAVSWQSSEVRRQIIDALVQARLGREWEGDVASPSARTAIRAWNAAIDAEDVDLRRIALSVAYDNVANPDDDLAVSVFRLDAPDADTRHKALLRLATIGDAARGAAPRVIPFLADENVRVRWAAARALGSIDGGSDAVLRALAEAAAADNVNVRCEAVKALGRIGVSNDVVLEALGKALQDEDRSVRALAQWASEQIGEEPIAKPR